MDFEFMQRLDEARHQLGFPFPITSGYRCPKHNAAVSSTGLKGPHTTGRAADIALSYTGARKALTLLSQNFTGIGIQQRGEGRFIHVDLLQPRLWSY